MNDTPQANGSDNASPTATGRKQNRKTLQVALPVTRQSKSYASSSRSSVDNRSEDGTNQRSTPATSVAITPAESEANRPNKRVSASTRSRELRSSTMRLGAAQSGQKRTASGLSKTDLDEALARALQAEEYNGVNKRQKASSGDDGDEEGGDGEDEEEEDAVTEYSDSLAGFEEPLDSEQERRRPRDKHGKKTRYVPQIVVGGSDDNELSDMEGSSFVNSDSESDISMPPLSDDDELPRRPQRQPPQQGKRNNTATTARQGRQMPKRFPMHNRPRWMTNRVCERVYPCVWNVVLIDSFAGMERTAEARMAASKHRYDVG